jgi:Tol biopolymer transport system component
MRARRNSWSTTILVAAIAALVLAAAPSHAAKAPRARIAYVASSDGAIHSVDLDGRHRQRLSATGAGASRPTWSPSGARIGYLVNPQGEGRATLRVMRANGTHRQTLIRGTQGREFLDLTWAPGGRRIALTMQNEGSLHDIAIYDLRSHKLVRLHVLSETGWRPSYIDWSSDGKRLVFSAYLLDDQGNPHDVLADDLWSVRADGTGVQRLTSTPLYETKPVWSPEGKRIAYEEGGSCPTVVIANADGTPRRRIPNMCAGDPDWAPGGARLVVTRRSASGRIVSLVRPDGTGRTDVARGWDATWRPR